MKLFVLGYPSDVGGADTELWHTVRLWRQFNVDVHLVPTWEVNAKWRERLDQLGCVTHRATANTLRDVPGLAGAAVVSFCNAPFLANADTLKQLGCKLIWSNCMTWLFDAEKKFYKDHGTFDAFHFQSEFQRSEMEPQLAEWGYRPEQGHLIHGAFDPEEFPFRPREHVAGDEFFVGRLARADGDKWSSNTIPIYERMQYRNKRAMLMGVDDKVRTKLGKIPWWVDCLPPGQIPARDFFSRLHCLMPINGGARENWPRAGLEAMAAGVPIVTQNYWGWREMVAHGETGFLGSSDEDLAHWAAVLAYDEPLRLRMAKAARERLVDEIAKPDQVWQGWSKLFNSLNKKRMAA